MNNATKSSNETESRVIDFPMHKVVLNLSHQLDHSDVILLAIKQLGQVVQSEQMSDAAKEAIEGIMQQLLGAAKSLSDGAFETGTEMQRFARKGS